MYGHAVKAAFVLGTGLLIETLGLPKLRLVIDGGKINLSYYFACDAQGADLSGQSQYQSNAALLPCCPVVMKSGLGVAGGVEVLVLALGVRHG